MDRLLASKFGATRSGLYNRKNIISYFEYINSFMFWQYHHSISKNFIVIFAVWVRLRFTRAKPWNPAIMSFVVSRWRYWQWQSEQHEESSLLLWFTPPLSLNRIKHIVYHTT